MKLSESTSVDFLKHKPLPNPTRQNPGKSPSVSFLYLKMWLKTVLALFWEISSSEIQNIWEIELFRVLSQVLDHQVRYKACLSGHNWTWKQDFLKKN